MVNESTLMQEEIWRKQREAEARVRRMREENRRLAQCMTTSPACQPQKRPDGHELGRWLPLVLAFVILKEGGPTLLVLALLYLAL